MSEWRVWRGTSCVYVQAVEGVSLSDVSTSEEITDAIKLSPQRP